MDFSEVHFSPRFDFFLVEMTVALMIIGYARWDHYMSLLENFQKECPSYMEMIWDELKEVVWYYFCWMSVSNVDLTNLLNRKGTNAPAFTEGTKASFNFSALETAGLAAKARKSGSGGGSTLSVE